MGFLSFLIKILLACLTICLYSGCSSEQVDITYRTFESEELLKRGSDLVNGLAACGFCHGESSDPQAPLAGGQLVFDAYGELSAANITPDQDTGIGNWTPQQIMGAVRSSIGPDEQLLSKQIHSGYAWMSDSDLLAIISYLQHQPAQKNDVERRSLGFTSRYTTGLFERHHDIQGFVPELPRADARAYGKYLVDHVARCSSCHGDANLDFTGDQYLSGGKRIQTTAGEKIAPRINRKVAEGQQETEFNWTFDQILQYLKTGVGPDGKSADNNFCPTSYFSKAGDDELIAIATYLHSLS